MSLEIKNNVPLAPLTTFKLGGAAEHFVTVRTEAELKEALHLARKNGWPVFVLADGSNLIVSSDGFQGLVIKVEITGLVVDGQTVTAGPAVTMAELIDKSIEMGLAGLEWAGGLPGSFGGAIRGNAGAFGGEMKDITVSVRSITIDSGETTERDHGQCQFEYRGSYFKHHPEVIVSAKLELHPGHKNELRQIADNHIQYRQEKHPLEYPNAGSIFKNIPLNQVAADILPQFAESIKDDPFPIVPTAKVLSEAGLKGLTVGGAQLSTKHSNYIVNLGSATAEDVVGLIDKIKTEIKVKYRIDLEVEPQLVGEFH